ncbi:hypothetical protein Lser_V15G26255 [Lactuca serriola]
MKKSRPLSVASAHIMSFHQGKRTTSVDQFVEFVQNLDSDSKMNKAIMVCQNLRVIPPDWISDPESDHRDAGAARVSSGSITVAAGDLLQPERIHNGIVFNVVRKGDLTPSNRTHDSENNSPSDSAAECVQLNSPEKDMDGSSGSECGDTEICEGENVIEPVGGCEVKDHCSVGDNDGEIKSL